MTAPGPLDALTATERALLALLANGHTAKTAAAQSGLSVAAVNERLRSARRKTGAVSSRELARLLAQEIRDEQIGLPSPTNAAAALALPAARWTGRRTMMAMTILAAAALAATLAVQQTTTEIPATDPLLGGMMEDRSIPEMHRQVRSERRDPEWAPAMEMALKARYARVPHLIHGGNRLRVTCGNRTCEVASPLPKDLPRAQEAQLVQDLQSHVLNKDVRALGFTDKGNMSGFGENFVAYWTRASK